MQTPKRYKAQFNRELIVNTQPQEPITTTNNAVPIDYIDEPQDEYAQLYDFLTGKQLICTNKHNIEDSGWLSKFKTAASEDLLLNLNQQINVAEEPIPFYLHRSHFHTMIIWCTPGTWKQRVRLLCIIAHMYIYF